MGIFLKKRGFFMLLTQKLYEADSFIQNFTATVLDCRAEGANFAAALDRTAFFPEGGGQPFDTGTLDGKAVIGVHNRDGVVWHTISAPLTPGSTVTGQIDWARRLDHMEQHTGEHILSGTLHRLYGAENVGFHIGQPTVRMDLDRPLSAEQLAQAERQANAAVRMDTEVRCFVPEPAELAQLSYRSKKELDGAVRIVEAGGDVCACCGTHLRRTGQVGLIKILSAQHYKGGLRLAVACGGRAFAAVQDAYADAEAAGRLLSAGPGRLAQAVSRLQESAAGDKMRLAELMNELAARCAAEADIDRPFCTFIAGADADGIRRVAVAVSGKTGRRCAVLTAGGQGLAYVLAAPNEDVRPLAKALNEAFSGRGGGKANLCQGSLGAADAAAVTAFLQR